MRDVLQDIRYGVRTLLKTPGYAAVVVLTLALAIAANTVIFSFTDILLLRPLPFRNPNRVVFVYGVELQTGEHRGRTSLADFVDWRNRTTAFEELGAYGPATYTMTGDDEPLRLAGNRVTVGLFRAWGLSPALGRLFLPGEDAPGAAPVAVLSHGFWERHFASDPHVVGRVVRLSGDSYTIVGVLTPEIEIGNLGTIDVWTPLSIDVSRSARAERTLRICGLLKRGATLEQAAAELQTISRDLQKTYPASNAGWDVRVLKLRDSITGPDTWLILTLLALVVAGVLLIACANVANLMLSRAIARQREIAVRIAIGATRFRLIRQLVTESLVLGVLGGAFGLLLAYGGLVGIKAAAFEPFFQLLGINGKVLGFVTGLSLLTPLLFSLVPALHASRSELNETLKEGGTRSSGGPRGRWSRNVLVTAQLSLAVMLLAVASLAVRTVVAVERVAPGFDTSKLLLVRLELPATEYSSIDTVRTFYRVALERVAALPDVRAVAVTSRVPALDAERPIRFDIDGRPAPSAKERPWAVPVTVSPGYFRSLGIAVISGREFSNRDRDDGAAVAIVGAETARRYWRAGGSAIGQRVRLAQSDAPDPNGRLIEIVGIVGDVKGEDRALPAQPYVYLPSGQSTDRSLAILVRTLGDPLSAVSSVRGAVRSIDPNLALYDVGSVEQTLVREASSNRILAAMFGAFGVVALLLAAAGLYAVISYSVSQRSHEIGIRIALGAGRGDVLRLIVGQGLRLLVYGSAIGLAGGLLAGRSMASILYGVGPSDPTTFAAVLGILTLVSLAASYLPARRASKVDPITTLRLD